MSDKTDKEGNIVKNLFNEMDKKVVLPSFTIVLAVVGFCIIFEENALAMFDRFFDAFVIRCTSLYLWYPMILFGIGLFLIFSKYGNVVLGDPNEKPKFSLFQYVSILIAMAFGATIMRTGLVNWALGAEKPAFGMEAFSNEALIYGNSYSMFIWGFYVFAIFGLAAPAFGYYLHVRKNSSIKISSILSEVFGEKFKNSIWGKIADIIFVVAYVFASATIIGLATPILAAVVSRIIGIETSFAMELFLTLVMVAIFSISACLGLKKGIQKLSEFNMYLAIAFMIMIVLVGPGLFIFDFFTDTIGHLVNNYVNYSFHANSFSDTPDHLQSYTVFWQAYNAGWAILHSIFLAIVSKGRTIREMLGIYFIAPQAIVLIFTGVLGGLGVNSYVTGAVPVLELLQTQGIPQTVTQILTSLPFHLIFMIIYSILALIFLSTTMDSSTYTIASYLSKNDLSISEPSSALRLMWAALVSGLAILMMFLGGLSPLEVLNGVMGIPIMVIQFLTIWAVFKMMNEDRAYIYNIRRGDINYEEVYSRRCSNQ